MFGLDPGIWIPMLVLLWLLVSVLVALIPHFVKRHRS